MGIVVAAHHLQLDQKVALKFLLPQALGNSEAVARFVREARNAVKIQSEHVARVSDVGELDNGAPYMVMEFLQGGDLAAWLKQNGPMPFDQAVDFVLQASVAVADAHALGIVHRDLKPANLFCVRRSDGQFLIKVLDFGISKMTNLGSSGPGMDMTRTAALMGTPLYMSPEQMRSSRDVDGTTDIWALGAILFELIAGKPPFHADSMTELVMKVAQDPPPPLRTFRPDAPAGLDAVIGKCVEKDRTRRYRNVGELAIALLPFAPKRAKGSVERISGIISAAGLSESALAVPVSPPVEATQASAGTLPPVGRTTIGGTGPKSATLGVGLLGAVALTAGVAFVVMNSPKPQPASSALGLPPPPQSFSAAASGTGADSKPMNTAVPVPDSAPVAATTPPSTPSSPSAVRVGPKGKGVIAASTASSPASPASAAPPAAAGQPTCSLVSSLGADGETHYKKVCK
jgi:serine/threonine-protein kinase